ADRRIPRLVVGQGSQARARSSRVVRVAARRERRVPEGRPRSAVRDAAAPLRRGGGGPGMSLFLLTFNRASRQATVEQIDSADVIDRLFEAESRLRDHPQLEIVLL